MHPVFTPDHQVLWSVSLRTACHVHINGEHLSRQLHLQACEENNNHRQTPTLAKASKTGYHTVNGNIEISLTDRRHQCPMSTAQSCCGCKPKSKWYSHCTTTTTLLQHKESIFFPEPALSQNGACSLLLCRPPYLVPTLSLIQSTVSALQFFITLTDLICSNVRIYSGPVL